MFPRIVLIVLLLGLAAACGKKGPLYLPDETAAPAGPPERSPAPAR